MLAFKKCSAIISRDLEASLGARACLCSGPLRSKDAAFCVCVVKLAKSCMLSIDCCAAAVLDWLSLSCFY